MTLRPPDIGLPRRLPPAGLEASDGMGALFSLAAALLTAGGVALASADSALLWAVGQALLALQKWGGGQGGCVGWCRPSRAGQAAG